MFLFSLSLISSRSILPFSASTSAVVFGRSRKDDGLMRNLEVSRPTGCGCRAEQRRTSLNLENIRTDPSFSKQTFGSLHGTVTLWAGRSARHQEKYDPCVASKEGTAGAGSERGRLFFLAVPILKIGHLRSATEPQQQRRSAADSVNAIRTSGGVGVVFPLCQITDFAPTNSPALPPTWSSLLLDGKNA